MEMKQNYNSMIYVHSGRVKIQDQYIDAGFMAEFEENNIVDIESISEDAGFLFLSAVPNNEPYSRGGPFVMNTREEILQAFEDYQSGRLF